MSELPQLEECTIVQIFGPVASGKSWVQKQWFQRMERAIWIDATSECLDPEECAHVWGNPQQLCQMLKENPYYYRIAYHPVDMQQSFNWCFNAIWQLTGNRWLIVDEVHQVCGLHSVHPMLPTVLRLCRHNGVGFIGASQKISDVNTLLRSNARMTVLFYTEESTDLDAIYKRWGQHVTDAVCDLRPCIYDDATHICYQHPECLVIIRGIGYKVMSLGDRVQSAPTGEQQQWSKISQPTQKKQESPSLAQNSGASVNASEESTSEAESQKLG